MEIQYKLMRLGSEKFIRENSDVILIKEIIGTYNLAVVSRKQEIVFKRQYLMWFMKTNLKLSYAFIGSILGGKDHATVLHAKRTVDNHFETKFKNFIEEIADLELKLKNTFPNAKLR